MPDRLRIAAQSALLRLFGVRLSTDIHERAADWGLRLPPGAKRRERLSRIAKRGILFVHVPKNGGTSIGQALYGMPVGHASARFYLTAAGKIMRTCPAFAVLREPEARFLSAYRHARLGVAADTVIHDAFRETYRAFRSIDDALDHIEAARSPYALDNIFRTQRWFLTDHAGALAVHNLVSFDQLPRLRDLMPSLGIDVPHLNRSEPFALALTAQQRLRLRNLYADDYRLFDAMKDAPPIQQSQPIQRSLRL
ncbi:sulfotransferase [Sphingomonas sp. MMS24-J13]|uniref:sulfotransferase n=1 Tax=Sphingomonas sp. MMS24-J13 TaxID=3238686 RepID=UPI00384D39EE